MVVARSIDDLFRLATGHDPFSYQRRLAERTRPPALLRVPTGSGKTLAILLLWLWLRRFQPDVAARRGAPRRLVYVLPMRTLMEQTLSVARDVLVKLGLEHEIGVHALLGGDADDDWLAAPEGEAILVGTQDMLLSRALNRGYAQSRFAWPRAFGLLHNDTAWVLDEIQLMGSGLASTTQLAGLQERMGTAAPVWWTWMSATAERRWLRTVDHDEPAEEEVVTLSDDDRQTGTEASARLARRLTAAKTLHFANVTLSGRSTGDVKSYVRDLAAAVSAVHRPGGLTLVVVNTVGRACQLYDALRPAPARGTRRSPDALPGGPHVLLLHSRFRAPDRRERLDALLGAARTAEGPGTITVVTQVVEAGVDISARTLISELAPWTSLVQRLGRLNRQGELTAATALWTDLTSPEVVAPYKAEGLGEAREQLRELEGQSVSPQALEALDVELAFRPANVLRRRDLLGLFDTTADLTEVDLDVSPYVRDLDEQDVQVHWRKWGPEDSHAAGEEDDDENEADEEAEAADDTPAAMNVEGEGKSSRQAPPPDLPEPSRDELCPAPVGELRQLIKKKDVSAFRRDPVDGRWLRVMEREVRPGLVVLLHARDGRYRADVGWDAGSTAPVAVMGGDGGQTDSQRAEPLSQNREWQTLAAHTDEVVREMDTILSNLALPRGVASALRTAARLHDLGKSHGAWQDRLRGKNKGDRRADWSGRLMAKAPAMDLTAGRRFLRHELASALALIANPELLDGCDDLTADLVRYLVASHHGKVRLALRSLVGERPPSEGPVRYQPPGQAEGAGSPMATSGAYALGILDGDELPPASLGGGVQTETIRLSLDVMALGTGLAGPSWSERARRLRDHLSIGPFRLGYYEALLRAADTRASGPAFVKKETTNV